MEALAGADDRAWGADLGVAGVADLSDLGSQAVAGRVVDDLDTTLSSGRRPATSAACTWTRGTTPSCGRSTRRPGCRPPAGSTRRDRPMPGYRGAPRVRVPPSRHRRVVRRPQRARRRRRRLGHDSTRAENFVPSSPTVRPNPDRDAAALHGRDPAPAAPGAPSAEAHRAGGSPARIRLMSLSASSIEP